jgi:hypothetical protein
MYSNAEDAPDIIPIIIVIGPRKWKSPSLDKLFPNKAVKLSKILIFTPLEIHILNIADQILLKIGRFTYIPYLLKGLCLKNHDIEITKRLETIIQRSKGDPEQEMQVKDDIRDFWGYIATEPFGLDPDNLVRTINNYGGETAMAIEDIKKEGLAKIATIVSYQEGLAKGLEKGRMEEVKRLLFDSLRQRYKDLSQKIRDTIQEIQDHGILQRLLVISYQSRSTASFEKKALKILVGAH